MNQEIKKLWIDALRSGKYVQGRWSLNAQGRQCCLGVLCELAHQAGVVERLELDGQVRYGDKQHDGTLPVEVQAWSGVESHGRYNEMCFLVSDNDEGKTFAEIADIIEREF